MIRTTKVAQIRREPRPPQTVDPLLADLYARVGLDERAAALRQVFDKSATIDRDSSSLTNDLDAARVRAVYSIIDGTKTAAEAALELDAVRRIAAAAPLVAELAELAKHQMHYDCAKGMYAEGDDLIRELDTVVQSAVAKIVEAEPDAGTISSNDAAMRAAPAARNAWSVLIAETERITAAQALASQLRVFGFVPTVREAGLDNWNYRNPDAVVDYDPARHAARATIANIAAGAGPCCATAAEVLAWVYRPPDEQAPPPPPSHPERTRRAKVAGRTPDEAAWVNQL